MLCHHRADVVPTVLVPQVRPAVQAVSTVPRVGTDTTRRSGHCFIVPCQLVTLPGQFRLGASATFPLFLSSCEPFRTGEASLISAAFHSCIGRCIRVFG